MKLVREHIQTCIFCILLVDTSTTSESKESNLLHSVEGCSCSVDTESLNIQVEQVEIEREIVTSSKTVHVDSNTLMVNTKQTAQKENPSQGTPVRFLHHGKPGGKVAKHMMAAAEDNDNNNQVKVTIQAGRKC